MKSDYFITCAECGGPLHVEHDAIGNFDFEACDKCGAEWLTDEQLDILSDIQESKQ